MLNLLYKENSKSNTSSGHACSFLDILSLFTHFKTVTLTSATLKVSALLDSLAPGIFMKSCLKNLKSAEVTSAVTPLKSLNHAIRCLHSIVKTM